MGHDLWGTDSPRRFFGDAHWHASGVDEEFMGLLRFMFAICICAVMPFDARGGVRDLEEEAATRIARRFVALAGSEETRWRSRCRCVTAAS